MRYRDLLFSALVFIAASHYRGRDRVGPLPHPFEAGTLRAYQRERARTSTIATFVTLASIQLVLRRLVRA
jgi:hypothetical protein